MRGNLFSARGLALLSLCGLCLVGCVLLAWWQWNRFESATGTLQNLGYVLQWPLFGLFPFYMFWRMRRLAAARDAAESAEAEPDQTGPEEPGRPRPAGDPPTTPDTGAESPITAETGAESPAARAAPEPAPRSRRAGPPPWRAPRPRVPSPQDEPDEELAAYNRYLAELHARDAGRAS
ncbi:transcriptional regulator [Gandjariella thermophila]|uniref:Lipoprotein LprD n=1 Tax=Gandjariella thermophila TaxID=1931992 RepID=A0A4D4J5F6_9PSEU|nr:transcriptional regulator [Gandjariella thermophila]GDY31925.1 hypothetical protein GTS_35580 [Gandjariella thermophila]